MGEEVAASLLVVRFMPFSRGEIKILMSQNHTSQREKRERERCGCEKPVEKFGAVFIEQTSAARRQLPKFGGPFSEASSFGVLYHAHTYIFYSNFAVLLSFTSLKRVIFASSPTHCLQWKTEQVRCLLPALHTFIPPKVPETFIILVCITLQITKIWVI